MTIYHGDYIARIDDKMKNIDGVTQGQRQPCDFTVRKNWVSNRK